MPILNELKRTFIYVTAFARIPANIYKSMYMTWIDIPLNKYWVCKHCLTFAVVSKYVANST